MQFYNTCRNYETLENKDRSDELPCDVYGLFTFFPLKFTFCFPLPKYYDATGTIREREMKGISLIPSGLALNRLFKSPQHRNQNMVLVDLDEYVPSLEARVNTSERHELTSQALAAEKEIMYAIENLNNKLDNSEIYA